MRAVEQFLALLFGAIVVMLVVTNATGVGKILESLGSFTGTTVTAFRTGGGLGGV